MARVAEAKPRSEVARVVDVDEAVVALEGSPTGENAPNEVTDSAEAAFLAETRAGGDKVAPAPAAPAEESDTKTLPPLDELVKRIPPEVRTSLEDLFRAKFIAVRRMPKSALKP